MTSVRNRSEDSSAKVKVRDKRSPDSVQDFEDSGVQLDDSPNHLCTHCDLTLTSDPSQGHSVQGHRTTRRLCYSSSSEGHSSSVSSSSDVTPANVTSPRAGNKMTATHEEERDSDGNHGNLSTDGNHGNPSAAVSAECSAADVRAGIDLRLFGGIGYSNMSGIDKPANSTDFFNKAFLVRDEPAAEAGNASRETSTTPTHRLTTRPVGGRSMRVPIIQRSPSSSQADLGSPASSELEKDFDSEGLGGKGMFLSAPEAPCKPPKKGKGHKDEGSSTKDRFKKFFEPLRRSQSALNGKEIPAYALFLRQDPNSVGARHCSQGLATLSVPSSGADGEGDDELRLRVSNTSISGAEGKSKHKRNIGTEVKRFFSMKRSGGGEGSGAPGREGRERVSLEALRGWASSIDQLLADKYGVQCFLEFLKSEFSEENLEFWIACSEYKSGSGQRSQQQMNALAQKIFADFVVHQAPREINIDAITRDLTYANMADPSPITFDAAQKRIQALMDKDSYPRFLLSDIYLQLLSEHSTR